MSESTPNSTSDVRFDVVGIGNALVDVIAHASDGFLSEYDLVKGSMTLIETDRAVELYGALTGAVEMSGGSAANTMCGVASFGGTAAYIGKVDDDDLGQVFGHDMRAVGVDFDVPAAESGPSTARCLILVTPDAQRTMSTYLGVSSLLEPDDVVPATVERASLLLCEGYLWDVDIAKDAIRTAMRYASDAGNKVSLTLSDSFCVDRHREEFLELIAGPVDIVFANDDQANRIWLNNGDGSFADSGQTLGARSSQAVAVGDFDGDGDLDLTFANRDQVNTLWTNDGSASFTRAGQTSVARRTMGISAGDLDGDGDLDLMLSNDGQDDFVLLNDGIGTFTQTDQAIGVGRSHASVLADLDRDGDLDVAIAGDGDGDTIWLNDGDARFTQTAQNIGLGHSRAIDAGDIDGDGDIDVVLGNHTGANSAWLNDGSGTFTDSGGRFGDETTEGLILVDIDGDRDLGLVVANDGGGNRHYSDI